MEKITMIDERNCTISESFGDVYKIFSKEFILGNDYEVFAELVQKYFILSPIQWENLLCEWNIKEEILSTKNKY